MARSRRTYRRSTSQRAASILAAALPVPVQRIADTRIGSTLMLFGIPALIVAGVLQLNWDGGIPNLTIDRDRAAELRNVAREEIGRIGNSNALNQLQESATELWNTTQGQYPNPYPMQPYANNVYAPSPQPTFYNNYDGRTTNQPLPIPSSSAAARYASAQTSPEGAYQNNGHANPTTYNPQPTTPQSYYQQPTQQQYYQPTQQPIYQQSPYGR